LQNVGNHYKENAKSKWCNQRSNEEGTSPDSRPVFPLDDEF